MDAGDFTHRGIKSDHTASARDSLSGSYSALIVEILPNFLSFVALSPPREIATTERNSDTYSEAIKARTMPDVLKAVP